MSKAVKYNCSRLTSLIRKKVPWDITESPYYDKTIIFVASTINVVVEEEQYILCGQWFETGDNKSDCNKYYQVRDVDDLATEIVALIANTVEYQKFISDKKFKRIDNDHIKLLLNIDKLDANQKCHNTMIITYFIALMLVIALATTGVILAVTNK